MIEAMEGLNSETETVRLITTQSISFCSYFEVM